MTNFHSLCVFRLFTALLLIASITACTRDESPVSTTDPTRIEANTPQELQNGLDNFLSALSQNPNLPAKIAQPHQKYGRHLAQSLSAGLPLDSIISGLANTQVLINGVPHAFEVHAWNPEAAASALRKISNQSQTPTVQSGGFEHPSIAFMIDPDGESYPDEDDTGNKLTAPSQHLVHLIDNTQRVLTLFPNDWNASQNAYNTLQQELAEQSQVEVAILILEPVAIDRQWVGCPTDENGVFLRGSGVCSGLPNPNDGGGGIGGSTGSGAPDKLHLVKFNLKRKYDGRSRDEIEFYAAKNNLAVDRDAEIRVYCRHKGWYDVNQNLMTLDNNSSLSRFIAIEDDNAAFIHRSKTFLGAMFGTLNAALAAAYFLTTLDPVGALQMLASGASKETIKNSLGTENSKMVKAFNVVTERTQDAYDFFQVGGLTWNADDILPESMVFGTTLNIMNLRTSGATGGIYRIESRLADMDYHLALRR